MPSHSSDPDLQGRLGKNDPRSLGDYEIVRRLATGGMAEIYLARHGKIAGLKTLVVIKRILPHLARDEQFTAMFLDEARIVASLDHPNVVRTIEVGVEDDEYFLALELVQGETMSRVLGASAARGERLEPRLAAYVVAQAAAGLHHAHTLHDLDGNPLHVVHRDVSPENIMVSFEGAVKVIDFGVARALNRVNQTLHGGPKGKAGYMAPEQARGDALDQRADIFSLGVVLWEMLVGRRLFRRDNDMASLRAIIEDAPPLLAEVAPDAAALQPVVTKALEKDPTQRLDNAAELALQLEAFIARGKSVGPADVAAFMTRTLPEQRARWREITRSAMALGHHPSTLRLPTLAARRTADLVTDDDAGFDAPDTVIDPDPGASGGFEDDPDTVRDDRAAIVGAARSVRPPAHTEQQASPSATVARAVSPAPPASVAAPVVEPSATTGTGVTSRAGRSSIAWLVISATLFALVGFAIVLVLRTRAGERSAPPPPPAPRSTSSAPTVAPRVDPMPAPPPPVELAIPAPAPEPPPEPAVARPAPKPPASRPSAPPRKPPPRAPRPAGGNASGFKPNPFD